jgi:hypothetical protein
MQMDSYRLRVEGTREQLEHESPEVEDKRGNNKGVKEVGRRKWKNVA